MSESPQPDMTETVTAAAANGGTLAHRTAKGSMWAGLAQLVQHGLRFVSSVVLAGLLLPGHFGLMALVWLTMMGIQMLSDLGLGPVIVRSERGSDPKFLNTAWTISIVRGLLLWGIGATLAWPVANWVFKKPEVGVLIAVCSSSALLRGASAITIYTLDREMRQDRAAILELVPQVVAFVVTVVWAIQRHSVWALVGGAMTGEVVRWALSYVLSNHRHRLAWDAAAAREFWDYGKWIFLSSIIGFFGSSADRIILGRLLHKSVLGIYSMAFNLVTIPSQIFLMIGWKVLFPALAAKHREGDIAEAHGRIKRALCYAGGVAAIGMVVAGPALVEVLYPPRFHDAGWMLRIISLGIWAQILDVLSYAAVMAKGQMRWVAVSMTARLVAIAALMPLGYSMYGVPGALATIPIADTVKYLAIAWGAERSGVATLGGDARLTVLIVPLMLGGIVLERSLRVPLGDYAPWLAAWAACGLWMVIRRHDADAVLERVLGGRSIRGLEYHSVRRGAQEPGRDVAPTGNPSGTNGR